MLVKAVAAWITFLFVLKVIHDILKLIVYSILSLCILMWLAITTLFYLIYNCVHALFSGVGNFANNIVLTVYKPIHTRGSTLYHF